MERAQTNPYAPNFEDLPNAIPIFPLSGVLLLPTGQLPLNIFEPRYLEMIEDAMAGSRMIGMIQPREGQGDPKKPSLYRIGCAGKITGFQETSDGRFEISLTGICRFHIEEELEVTTPYRQVACDWSRYEKDLENVSCLNLDRDKLEALLGDYFKMQGMRCDWGAVKGATDGRLITCLSMICPFDAKEKQALLEAGCCRERAKTFMTMLELAARQAANFNEHMPDNDQSSCH